MRWSAFTVGDVVRSIKACFDVICEDSNIKSKAHIQQVEASNSDAVWLGLVVLLSDECVGVVGPCFCLDEK